VLTRAVPWAGKSHLQILTALMIRGERLPTPTMAPGKGKAHAAAQSKLVDVMAQCWHADHSARPQFARVLTTLEDLMALHFPDEWARLAGAQARMQEREPWGQQEQEQQEKEEQEEE
jgi:hypothetical protein